MKQRQTDAFIVGVGGVTLFPERKRVAEHSVQNRLPAIAAFKQFAQAGLLLSYGPDLADINRRAAGYVDRILKGARPADMPIEMPDKMDLVINLATAKARGLEIPQPLRLRADDVIQSCAESGPNAGCKKPPLDPYPRCRETGDAAAFAGVRSI